MFRKVLFIWSSIPIFSFIGYTLTKLFRKPDNSRQIYKQTSSNFYRSNDVSRRKNYLYVITRSRNSQQRCRSSHRRCSIRKSVLKNFANFTGKHLCWILFLWSCKPAACKFLKKGLQYKCFPVKFAKLFRIPILRNICKRLLLEVFFKKAVLKNFAIFIVRKKPVISVLWKSCSWWLIELWKWRVFILINISCKSSSQNELFFP